MLSLVKIRRASKLCIILKLVLQFNYFTAKFFMFVLSKLLSKTNFIIEFGTLFPGRAEFHGNNGNITGSILQQK